MATKLNKVLKREIEVDGKPYMVALSPEGVKLTENICVLQYIADRNPAAKLAPPAGTMERYRLVEWLAFINSEIHKSFGPLFRKDAPDDTKNYARQNIATRAGWLNSNLGARSFLMGEQFTVADAYLYTVLSWAPFVKLDLGKWPELKRYVDRIHARPHVHEALQAEGLKAA